MAQFCASRTPAPKALICASAIGYYGSRAGEVLTETSAPGNGFLAEVAREWEAAAEPARAAGIRVIHLRIGVVLSKHGGALKTMLLPFQLGIGGKVGAGEQWLSWITLDDLVRVIIFSIETSSIAGSINCTAPQPVTNAEFVRTLAYVLNRPAIFSVPAFALRLLPGNMADETFLSSERVIPKRLIDAGFRFGHPGLLNALQSVLRVTVD